MSAATLVLAPVTVARGSVTLPGSKSISNRSLLLSALALGTTTLVEVLEADDTDRMREALSTLGVALAAAPGESDRGITITVVGTQGRFPISVAELFLGNAGTAVRPLTAVLAVLGGDYFLDGVPRMRERPIGDLVDALVALGADVRYAGLPGYPPLAIGDAGAQAGQTAAIRGDVSSQFLSALLMALPLARGASTQPTTVAVTTPLISRPYVEITLNLMRRFGVDVVAVDGNTFVVPASSGYQSPGTLAVEGDASSASYFLAAGVLGGGPVRVEGVGRASIQGDIAFVTTLETLGADLRYTDHTVEARAGASRLRGGIVDCTAIPDAAMTLAMTALFADSPTTLTGIGSWRVKETDRIAAMATELAKLGASVATGDDWLRVTPLTTFRPAAIDTYDDHRMAMCFSLAAFGGVPVTINDPGCVSKTFPGYFAALRQVTS
jgi:3-phosphoshikimate 1-carboxyvinyltransferase